MGYNGTRHLVWFLTQYTPCHFYAGALHLGLIDLARVSEEFEELSLLKRRLRWIYFIWKRALRPLQFWLLVVSWNCLTDGRDFPPNFPCLSTLGQN